MIELNDFRQEKQQPFQRRDFDLYDPEALRKEQPARVSDEDERLKHRSNLQMFEGEDLKHQERSLEQKKQMRCWALQGMWERELKKRENQRETA